MAKPIPSREVRCYLCGHAFEVSAKAMTSSCPQCHKGLRVEDVVVKNVQAVRRLQTCGKLTIERKGRVIASLVEAQGGIDCKGALEGRVVCGGSVRIGKSAEWKGDCRATSLRVEAGAKILGGYFDVQRELVLSEEEPSELAEQELV